MSDFRVQRAMRAAATECEKMFVLAWEKNVIINRSMLTIELLVNYEVTPAAVNKLITLILTAKKDYFIVEGDNIIPVKETPPELPELPLK